MQLYGEYDSRTNGRNDVGDDQRPVFKHDSLDNENTLPAPSDRKVGVAIPSVSRVRIVAMACGR